MLRILKQKLVFFTTNNVIFIKNKTKYYAWSGNKTANHKTPNINQRNNKTAKNKMTIITKQRTQQRANFCEKRRTYRVWTIFF